MYFEGYVVKKDYGIALELVKDAAEKGDVDAQYSFDYMNLKGQGVVQDVKFGWLLLKQCSFNGYLAADVELKK